MSAAAERWVVVIYDNLPSRWYACARPDGFAFGGDRRRAWVFPSYEAADAWRRKRARLACASIDLYVVRQTRPRGARPVATNAP